MRRERQLSDQERRASCSDTETEANQSSGADEHADVLTGGSRSMSGMNVVKHRDCTHWMAVAISMIQHPLKIPNRRPYLSAIPPAMGREQKPPMD